MARLCDDCQTTLVVNVIYNNISIWWLHQIAILQAKAVTFPPIGAAAVGQFLPLSQQLDFPADSDFCSVLHLVVEP